MRSKCLRKFWQGIVWECLRRVVKGTVPLTAVTLRAHNNPLLPPFLRGIIAASPLTRGKFQKSPLTKGDLGGCNSAFSAPFAVNYYI